MIVKKKPYDGSFSALITREVVPRHLQTFTKTNSHQNTLTAIISHQNTFSTINFHYNTNQDKNQNTRKFVEFSFRCTFGRLGIGQEMKAVSKCIV